MATLILFVATISWLIFDFITYAPAIPDYSNGKLPLTFATHYSELQKELFKIHEEGGLEFLDDYQGKMRIRPTPVMSVLLAKSKSIEFKKLHEEIKKFLSQEKSDDLRFVPHNARLFNISRQNPGIFHEFLGTHSDFFEIGIPVAPDNYSNIGEIMISCKQYELLQDLFALYRLKYLDELFYGDWDNAMNTLDIIVEVEICVAPHSARFNGLRYITEPFAKGRLPDNIVKKLLNLNEKLLQHFQRNTKDYLMFRRIKAMLSFERLREERCSEGVFMNLLRCLDWKDIVLFNLKSIRESILWAWDDYRYDVDKDTFLALNGVYRPIIENCNLPFYELSMSNEWPGKKLKIPKSCHDANSILKELCDTIYPDEPFRSILFHKAYNAAMKIYKADELSEDDMTSPLTGKFYKVSFVGVEIRLETGAFSLRIPVPESDSEFIEDLKKRIKHINQEFY